MQSTCLEHQWATRGVGRGQNKQKNGRPQGNLFYQPDIRLKKPTKNNLIDVPEKTISSFTEASKKITVLKSVVKI